METTGGQTQRQSDQSTASALPVVPIVVQAKPPSPPSRTDLAYTQTGTVQPVTEPEKPKPVGPVEIIAWTITAVGIATSLGWNYLNQRNQKKFQTKTRSDQIRLEEFRRIRTPIDAALGELRVQRDTLRALAASAKPTPAIRREAAGTQRTLTEKYLNLEQALADADNSRFAEGQDWLQPVEVLWDRAVTALEPVTVRRSTRASVIISLTEGVDQLTQILRLTNMRLENEVSRFTESPT